MLQWDRNRHLETAGITGQLNSLAWDGVCKYTNKAYAQK